MLPFFKLLHVLITLQFSFTIYFIEQKKDEQSIFKLKAPLICLFVKAS